MAKSENLLDCEAIVARVNWSLRLSAEEMMAHIQEHRDDAFRTMTDPRNGGMIILGAEGGDRIWRCARRYLEADTAKKARTSADLSFVASPVTGGGHAVGRFGLLFLDAMAAGRKQTGELASHAWSILAAQGQRLIKEGKPLESQEDNLAELTRQAASFLEKQVPILRALQVV